MRRSLLSVFVASLLSTFALGCSDLGTHSLAIEGSEQVVNGITTTDGWTVSFEQFVVVVHNPGLIERTDDKPAWVREAGVTVWDVSKALAEGEALSRQIRATRYDGADFRIAPASESSPYEAVAGNVEHDVVHEAEDDDWSIHVVGSATDGMSTVTFDWTFDTNSFYRCKLEGDEVLELGADGDETTVIEIMGELLIGESFQPIADAAGGDGSVTQAELESAGLWDAIDSASAELGGVRGAGSCPLVEE